MDMVDKIWDVYDDDGNGVLDYDETRKFLIDYMKTVGIQEEDEDFDEDILEEMFK